MLNNIYFYSFRSIIKGHILFGENLMKRKLSAVEVSNSSDDKGDNKRIKTSHNSEPQAYSIADYFRFYLQFIDSNNIGRSIETYYNLSGSLYQYFNSVLSRNKRGPSDPTIHTILQKLAYYGSQFSLHKDIFKELQSLTNIETIYSDLHKIYKEYIVVQPTAFTMANKLTDLSLVEIFDACCASLNKSAEEVNNFFDFQVREALINRYNYYTWEISPFQILNILSYHPQGNEIRSEMVNYGWDNKIQRGNNKEEEYLKLCGLFRKYNNKPDLLLKDLSTISENTDQRSSDLPHLSFFSNPSSTARLPQPNKLHELSISFILNN